MPIARYRLENELSLGDPGLYRAADKDDPETLLEAVAMAGLAGLLRQLGDLSQFAAEIFHNLHEEVMVTAARGQGLMARVQQIEAEVPSLEKAFLSQTHNLSFFSKGGIGWHPNLQSAHNLISHGDMPRFVMDSYEECRGPPQLFLLDKFDVAGAGACLKRYTDPSFFKLESASSGLATVEVYREKKKHKIKKKGTRIRNGETPEVASTHTKLHQLLLEERIENACSDSGRHVKLKNRQLNGSATEAKTGKSYMDKFLESPVHDDFVHENSVSPPNTRLVSDDTSEEGIKILEISTVGPVKRSLEIERTYSWTNEEEAILKPSSEMRRNKALENGDIVKKHEQGSSRVSDEISSNYSKVPDERELEINKQRERENFLYGYHSDDLTSEVDHHLDALATLESELNIDYKYRNENSSLQKLNDSDDKEHQQQDRFLHSQSFSDSLMADETSSLKRDINEVHSELQARLSDSQSGTSFTSDGNNSLKRDRKEKYSKRQAKFSDFQYIGESSTSDAIIPFDKDIPCFSCSDSLSTVGESTPSEPVSFKSNKYNGSEIEDTSSSQLTQNAETQKTDRGKFLMHDDTYDHEKVISGTGDVSSGSYLMNSGRKILYSDLASTSTSRMKISKRAQSKETSTGLTEHQLRLADEGTKHHAESIDVIPDAFSRMNVDADVTVSSEKYPLNEVADGDQSVSCDAISKISNDLKLASEDERSECSNIKGLQAESPNQDFSDILVCREIDTEEHPICSSTEVDLHSSRDTLMLDVQPSKAADGTEATRFNSQGVPDSVGVEANCYDQQSNFKELSEMDHSDEFSRSTCRVDTDEDDSLLKGSSSGDYDEQDYHVRDDVASTELLPEDQSVSVDAAENDVNIAYSPTSSMMISSASRNLSDLQQPVPGTSSHETKMEFNEVEPIKIVVDLNEEKMENQQELSSDSNAISSSMGSFTESCSTFADPQEKQREISKAIVRESLTKLEKRWGMPQLNAAACANVELSLNRAVTCDNSEICDNFQGSSPMEQPEHSSVKDKILRFSKLDSQEPKSVSLLQSKRLRNGADGLASSFSKQLESGNHSEKFLRLQDAQGDAGSLHRCAENSSPKKPQSEQMQTSNHLGKERNSHAASTSVPEMHQGQPSSFESLPLSASQDVNFTKHDMNKPLPDPISEAPKISFGEMPPMPPLPPMQWRTGKVQPASLASHGEVLFQPTQPINNKEQAQDSLPTSEREALQFQNPVFPVMAVEGDKLQNTSGFFVGGHPVAISMQLPIMLNEVNGKYNYVVLERSQTHNPFQTLPVPVVVPASKPAQGYIVASEGEMVQNSNTRSPIAPVERATYLQDPISPQKLSPPPSQPNLAVKTLQQSANNLEGKQGDPSISSMSSSGMEDVQPNHNLLPPEEKQGDPSNSPMSPQGMESVLPNHNLLPSEGKQGDPSNSPMSSPGMENVRPNHSLLRSESEMATTLDKSALASDFERERLNGKPNDKLPRPQSPVVDAIAALDKSKLRKVSEGVRPPIVPKVEEKTSFLEQIRTKSFNLRPTATTRKRYHYQGPRTNLKVAAILDKANAIRQALAGSDEDDDKDSWSDS